MSYPYFDMLPSPTHIVFHVDRVSLTRRPYSGCVDESSTLSLKKQQPSTVRIEPATTHSTTQTLFIRLISIGGRGVCQMKSGVE